jgi:twitching motility protein PilT
MLAESLKAIVSQTLCQNLAGQGRLAAYEVMVVTTAIRHLIRESKIAQIYSAIQTGQSLGMQTLDQHLAILRDQNLISVKEARQKAVNKDFY